MPHLMDRHSKLGYSATTHDFKMIRHAGTHLWDGWLPHGVETLCARATPPNPPDMLPSKKWWKPFRHPDAAFTLAAREAWCPPVYSATSRSYLRVGCSSPRCDSVCPFDSAWGRRILTGTTSHSASRSVGASEGASSPPCWQGQTSCSFRTPLSAGATSVSCSTKRCAVCSV